MVRGYHFSVPVCHDVPRNGCSRDVVIRKHSMTAYVLMYFTGFPALSVSTNRYIVSCIYINCTEGVSCFDS